jgi:hypothetical protein
VLEAAIASASAIVSPMLLRKPYILVPFAARPSLARHIVPRDFARQQAQTRKASNLHKVEKPTLLALSILGHYQMSHSWHFAGITR